MIIVKFPEANVDYIEIFIAEEVRISVNIRFSLYVEQTLKDSRLFELSEGHFVVIFSICHVKHSVNDTKRVPLLELRSLLEEL